MVTHIAGGGIAVLALLASVVKAVMGGSMLAVVCAAVYGVTMVGVYAMSSIYHGLPAGTAKKVMQIIDHCAIYFLIAGTYTPIVLCALAPAYPAADSVGCDPDGHRPEKVPGVLHAVLHWYGLERGFLPAPDLPRFGRKWLWLFAGRRHCLYGGGSAVWAGKEGAVDACGVPYLCGAGKRVAAHHCPVLCFLMANHTSLFDCSLAQTNPEIK